MGIIFSRADKVFKLDTASFTWAFQINATGHLIHLYSGPQTPAEGLTSLLPEESRAFSPVPQGFPVTESLDTPPQEYGTSGVGDFRTPSFIVRAADGTRVTDPVYESHRIFAGKKAIPGLPASFASDEECDTLEVTLTDRCTKVHFILTYAVFRDLDVVARSVRAENGGTEAVMIEKLDSVTMDLRGQVLDLISFQGTWARERQFQREKILQGKKELFSTRGYSSHQCNPAFILAEPDATETAGRATGFVLLYSGDFSAGIERDPFSSVRAGIGLNAQTFSWNLEPGDCFHSPEALVIFSRNGLGELSRTSHKFFRRHVIRSAWRDRERPILINNWEATYFDFNAEKLLNIARKAAELGVEMLVLDDGWFGKRNDDHSGLGDWFVNEKKLSGGFRSLVPQIQKLGLKFGLWFEPEMISPDSDLYRAHPDWCLHVEKRNRTEGRQQLVLDFSRPEIVDAVFEQMTKILDSAGIEYIKWDANRHLTEVGSPSLPADRQKEVSHRYMLGLYSLLERLMQRYPKLLIEGCSGGGGRFDGGMLYYTPQIWCSDDSDAVERLHIQYGTSFFYPQSAMGAHVTACPNHQVGRTTPFETRACTALAGTFGYELDLNRLPPEEQEMVREQNKRYHRIHPLVADGDLYRLTSPETDPVTAWMNVSPDRTEFVFTAVLAQARGNAPFPVVRLQGLIPEGVYEDETGFRCSGSLLMNAGLTLKLTQDAQSEFRHFRMVRKNG